MEELRMFSALFKKLTINMDLFKWKSKKKQSKLHRGQNLVSNIPCVNDQAERVTDLIEDLYANCTDEIL